MQHRHSRLYALTGALCIAIFACGGSKSATRVSSTLAERDDFGDSVVVDASHRPSRIVSLNPTTTEILFAIGAGNRVAGRSTYDVFPVEAKSVTDVGMPLRPNVEAVLAVHPDLVILYASADNRPATQRFQRRAFAHSPSRSTASRSSSAIRGSSAG
jgi:iron complex transport system substrate-binding protein